MFSNRQNKCIKKMDNKRIEKEKPAEIPSLRYFNSLSPQKQNALRIAVMSEAGVSATSFWRWINGKSKPSLLSAKCIAEHANQPLEVLYPNL